ncbi:MAG: DUF4870 domain-containing protein [Myxococcaceae bacterium]
MATDDPLKALEVTTPPREAVREQDKIMLVFCYLSLLALIPLLTVRDSPYVRWHAKNGLVLTVAGFVLGALFGSFKWLSCLLVPLFGIAYLIVMVMAISKALQGERWRIPGVTDLAEKL